MTPPQPLDQSNPVEAPVGPTLRYLTRSPRTTPLKAFKDRHGLNLDPRTKVLILIAVNFAAMGPASFTRVQILSLPVVILLAFNLSLRAWLIYVINLLGWFGLYWLLLGIGGSFAVAFLALIGYWIARMMVVIGIGTWVVVSTRPSELTAAMLRLRFPRAIVVPAVVMLRFIPTVFQEITAITEAQRLRGVFPGAWGTLTHPLRTVEYLLVPLLSQTARISDDLAASGIVRGLGRRGHHTCVTRIGFHWIDALVAAPILLYVIALTAGV